MTSAAKLSFEFPDNFHHLDLLGPVFLRHKGVQGGLRLLNGLDNDIDMVKIVLKGTLVNSIAHGCSSHYDPHRLLIEQTIFKLTDVQDSVPARQNADSRGGEIFRFVFPLSQEPWNSNDRRISKVPRTLPSSLSITGPWCSKTSTGQNCCNAESRVKYVLQAFAHHGDHVVASASQEVKVFDTADPSPPPIHAADFPGEYVCSQEKRLKWLMSKGRRLGIATSEPKPLIIHAHKKAAMAAFHVRFSLRSDSNSLNPVPPGPLDVRINSTLKVSTYIAVGTMLSHPTLRNSQVSPLLATISRNGKMYQRKLRLKHSGWKHDSSETGREWIQDATVWLPVSEHSSPTPSFFTPYLSRRYSVAMRIDAKNGEGSAVFHLNVPLQIVYASDAPMYTEFPDESWSQLCGEVPERLPLYVR